MTSQFHSVGITGIVVALLILLISKPSAADRWKRRFRAFGSPLIESPRFRILFVLVIVGILLISLVPEAAVVIAAVDTVGLDIVTMMVFVELGRYLTSISRLLSVSAIAIECRRRIGRILSRGPLMMTSDVALRLSLTARCISYVYEELVTIAPIGPLAALPASLASCVPVLGQALPKPPGPLESAE